MNPRRLSAAELFHQKLKVLVPNAVCSIRIYDNNEHLVKNPILRGDFLIDWADVNTVPCPSLSQIEAVSDGQVSTKEEADRKTERNNVKAEDLSLIASYEIEKKSNPDLTFSDYLDSLEGKKPKKDDTIPPV